MITQKLFNKFCTTGMCFKFINLKLGCKCRLNLDKYATITDLLHNVEFIELTLQGTLYQWRERKKWLVEYGVGRLYQLQRLLGTQQAMRIVLCTIRKYL